MIYRIIFKKDKNSIMSHDYKTTDYIYANSSLLINIPTFDCINKSLIYK